MDIIIIMIAILGERKGHNNNNHCYPWQERDIIIIMIAILGERNGHNNNNDCYPWRKKGT